MTNTGEKIMEEVIDKLFLSIEIDKWEILRKLVKLQIEKLQSHLSRDWFEKILYEVGLSDFRYVLECMESIDKSINSQKS